MDKHIISSYQPDATHGPFACIKKTMNDEKDSSFQYEVAALVLKELLCTFEFGHRQIE